MRLKKSSLGIVLAFLAMMDLGSGERWSLIRELCISGKQKNLMNASGKKEKLLYSNCVGE